MIGDWKKETFSVKVHTYIGISYLSHLYIYEYFHECFLYEINGFYNEVIFHLEGQRKRYQYAQILFNTIISREFIKYMYGENTKKYISIHFKK